MGPYERDQDQVEAEFDVMAPLIHGFRDRTVAQR